MFFFQKYILYFREKCLYILSTISRGTFKTAFYLKWVSIISALIRRYILKRNSCFCDFKELQNELNSPTPGLWPRSQTARKINDNRWFAESLRSWTIIYERSSIGSYSHSEYTNQNILSVFLRCGEVFVNHVPVPPISCFFK